MVSFGMHGRLVAHPGRREELVEVLMEGTEHLSRVDGCELYVINRDVDEPNTIWVIELWRDEAAHRASLDIPEIRAVIERGMPLIAGFDGVKLEPVGGVGVR